MIPLDNVPPLLRNIPQLHDQLENRLSTKPKQHPTTYLVPLKYESIGLSQKKHQDDIDGYNWERVQDSLRGLDEVTELGFGFSRDGTSSGVEQGEVDPFDIERIGRKVTERKRDEDRLEIGRMVREEFRKEMVLDLESGKEDVVEMLKRIVDPGSVLRKVQKHAKISAGITPGSGSVRRTRRDSSSRGRAIAEKTNQLYASGARSLGREYVTGSIARHRTRSPTSSATDDSAWRGGVSTVSSPVFSEQLHFTPPDPACVQAIRDILIEGDGADVSMLLRDAITSFRPGTSAEVACIDVAIAVMKEAPVEKATSASKRSVANRTSASVVLKQAMLLRVLQRHLEERFVQQHPRSPSSGAASDPQAFVRAARSLVRESPIFKLGIAYTDPSTSFHSSSLFPLLFICIFSGHIGAAMLVAST